MSAAADIAPRVEAPLRRALPITRWRNPALRFASAATLILIWYIGAFALPSSVLPMPHTVVMALARGLATPTLWGDIGVSLVRIAAAFVIAMAAATILGFAMALSKTAGVFFEVWIVCGITVPALVTILMLYMIAGLNETAAVLGAALPVIPIIAINIREGVKAIDPKLLGMARAFRANRRQVLVSIITPQVAPSLLASARFGLGLIWKMVLFVELLGRGNGIGYKIEFYYQMFNMTQVLAHALSFVFIMIFIEMVVLRAIETRVFRWR